jgi:eukaryotic-like serine/threonine-protein kinase
MQVADGACRIASTSAFVTLTPGTRIGTFDITALIGAGGMGEVYLARDSRLDRNVAIKVLPDGVAADPDRIARFDREAKALAALNHPNIAQILGVEDSGGIRALVMEFVDGPTLADRIASGPIPFDAAVSIATQIAGALDAAHGQGIIHRDLKPANLKVRPDGTVKVLDFGLAKLEVQSDAASQTQTTATMSATRAGIILGTAAYMSPEQTRGLPIDKRTDIWAFGCVLYEMLTGRAAFARDTLSDTIAAVLERAPDWPALPADAPPNVRRLIERCLDKNLKRRSRDIGDVQLDLEALDKEMPAQAQSAVQGPLAPRTVFGWPFVIASLLALVFGIAAARPFFTARGNGPTFSRVTQLANGDAFDFGPAISPDGKWIAYLSNARGPTDVWVRFLSGGDPVNLTAATQLEVQSRVDLGGLAISPDGSSIAFDAGATKGTPAPRFDSWVIPAPLGGTPRKVVELGRALRWSPDGTQIVFVRPGSSAGDALYVARADGGSPREVVMLRGGMHIHWPAWSHDGRYIYFNYSASTANREPTSIYRVQTTGGPIEPVVATARRAVFPFPTSDGSGLIYSANPNSVDLALWWRPLDATEPRRLTTGVGEYSEPAMTPDGRTMVSSLIEVRQGLSAFTISDGPSSPQPITNGTTGDIDPVLSPDGGQLVFSSSRSGYQNIWTARPDGTMARALTSGNAFDERPAFSPDGQRLAFVSDRGGHRSIWTMKADGGIPERLIDVDVIDRLLWTPDGRRIVFAITMGDVPTLQSVSVADRGIERVVTPGPAVGPFAFVDNSIAYLEPFPGQAGTPNVNRVAFAGSSGKPASADALRTLNLANGIAVLSPDGQRLAALVEPGGAAGSLWVADVNRNAPFRKVTDLPSDVRVRGAAWTSGNDRLIVGTVQRRSHLVLFDQGK